MDQREYIYRINVNIIRLCPSHSALFVGIFKIPSLRKTTASYEPERYTLKIASFEENLDRATRQACSVLSENDCKDLQRMCLGHFLSNWDIFGPIGEIAVDEVHTVIHW